MPPITPTMLSLSTINDIVTIVDPTDSAMAANNNGGTARDTVVVDYSLAIDGVDQDGQIASGIQTVDLLIKSVDFSIDGMTRNQTEVGNYINRILTVDEQYTDVENDLTRLFALIANIEDDAAGEGRKKVIDLIDRLTTEGYAATRVDTLFSGLNFADAVSDCERRTHDRYRRDYRACFWAEGSVARLTKDDSFEFKAIESKTHRFRGGLQVPFDPNWSAGIALGYDMVDLSLGDRFTTDGDRGHLGLNLKYNNGGLTLAGAVTASHGAFDSTRIIGIDEHVATIWSEKVTLDKGTVSDDITQANLRIGAAYRMNFGNPRNGWYFQPSVDLNATYIYSHDAVETGLGPVGAAIEETGEWIFSASPSIEIGASLQLNETSTIEPFVRLGLTAFSDDELSIKSRFSGAPESAGTFTNWSNFDQLVGNISVGAKIANDSSYFSLGYEGTLGDKIEEHKGQIRYGVKLN